MKGWGAQDDFQEQIMQTVNDRLSLARSRLEGDGKDECEDCGDTIPHARREAYPACVRCIRCQTLFEKIRR